MEALGPRQPLDSARNDALVRLADRASGGGGDQQRPLRHPVPAAGYAALAAVQGRTPWPTWTAGCPPGPAPISAPGSSRRPAWPATPSTVELAAELGRDLAFDLELVAPRLRLPVPAGPHRDDLAAAQAGRPGRDPALRPQEAERTQGLAPDRLRAGHDRAARASRLLPDRLGHRRVLPPVGHPARAGARRPARPSAARSGSPRRRRHLPRPAVRWFISRRDVRDIDLDIEAGRREEVIEYVHQRYGRDRGRPGGQRDHHKARSAGRDDALGYARSARRLVQAGGRLGAVEATIGDAPRSWSWPARSAAPPPLSSAAW